VANLILYIGDSLGQGTVPRLKAMAGYAINARVKSGASSAWGESQVDAALTDKHRLVVFDMGTNDGNNPGPFIARLNSILDKIGDRTLVVATLNGAASGMNANIQSWADAHPERAVVVPWRKYTQDHPGVLANDGIHAKSPADYKLRAQLFYKYIPRANDAKEDNYDYDWQASRWKNAKQWRKWERVGMRPSMDLNDLRLHWTERKRPDLVFKDALVSLGISRSIETSTTITLAVADPRRKIFSVHFGRMRRKKRKKGRPAPVDVGWEPLDVPNVVGNPVELILDDVVFRLVKIEHNWDTSITTMTFEDRVIYWLRHKFGHRKISRSKVTRAEFVLSQLREIKQEKVPFICPELHKDQPVGKSKKTGRKKTSSEPGDNGGGGKGAFSGRVTVKGVTATAIQKHNCDIAFTEANSIEGVGEEALALLAFCMIGESGIKNLPGGDATSVGILQLIDSTARGTGVDPKKITEVVHHFMTKGYYQKSGIEAARSSGSMMEQAHSVQGFGTPYSGVTEAEARRWVKAWGGDPGGTGGSTRGGKYGTYKKPFLFTRGPRENAWKCMRRYAEEVEWRLFMVGRAMYFMSEDDLYRRRVRYKVTPQDESLKSFQFNMDWGRRASGATMRVNLDRWGAPPGSVILLDGFGPPDGRWLVTAVDRDWFSPEADITLTQPVQPLREPAQETETREGDSGGGGGQRSTGDTHPPWRGKYSVSGVFGEQRGATSYGGPHAHGGMDVSVPYGSPLFAPFDGTITYVSNTGFGSAGGMIHVRAGRSIPHVIEKGDKIGFGHQSGARVNVGDKVKAGQRVGTSNGSPAHVHFVLIKAGEGGNGVDGNHNPEHFLKTVGGI